MLDMLSNLMVAALTIAVVGVAFMVTASFVVFFADILTKDS